MRNPLTPSRRLRRVTATAIVALLAVVACDGAEPSATGTTDSSGGPADTTAATDVAGPSPTTDGDSADAAADTPPGNGDSGTVGLSELSDEALPDSLDARTGTLDNGLQYYVMANDRPGAKASLRLAVRAGSVDELGAETGVAHFVEHMMFNGTDEYPENELINVLRSFGANLGPDVNAYTSTTETVYMLDVPADDDSVALGLDVLDQWLNDATIAEADVDAEHGVVLEEWRGSTQTVNGRLFDVARDLYLADTPYNGRAPIGTADDIEAMSVETLRTYYDTWYRPDNVAVIVVGDIDVDEVADLIVDTFDDAAPRVDSPLPATDAVEFGFDTTPDFALHSDPDQSTVDVEVTLPLPAIEGVGTLALRAELYDDLIYDILVRRLERDVAAGLAPFDDIGPGGNSLVPELDAPALYAYTDADRVDDTLAALLDEYERAYRFGFSDAEVAAAVAGVRSELDALLAQDGERQDAALASAFVANFLDGEAAATIRDVYEAATVELDAVDAARLNDRFDGRWEHSAPHVIISTPMIVEAEMPTRDEVLAAIDAAADADIEPRADITGLPDELIARPDPVASTSERSLTRFAWEQFDPIEYTYPNGARVILNPNTIEQGTLYLSATSPGGLSLIDDADVIDAIYAGDIVNASGIAEFDAVEFAEITSSSQAEVTPSIELYDDRIEGEAASADVETMLQMVHLYMTQPRFDGVALNQVVRREQPAIDDPSIAPGRAGTDALNAARSNDEIRYEVLPAPDDFATLDLDGVERVWAQRFGNASDWVFVITGDFDRDELLALVDSYVGTLPGDGTIDEPVDYSPPMPNSPEEVAVAAGSGDAASVEMVFSSEIAAMSPNQQALADAATAVLDARLTRVLREEFGDAYSPSITVFLESEPTPVVQTYVYVAGSPERIETIADTVVAEIGDIESGGLSHDEFDNSLGPVIEQYGFVNNGEYIRELQRVATIDGYPLDDYVFAPELIGQVTRDDVVDFIVTHLDTERYVSSIVTPRS